MTYPTNWVAGGSETECGSGSLRKNMPQIIKHLPRILKVEYGNALSEPGGPSIVELGCGDLNFAKACGLLTMSYRGFDIKRRDSWNDLPANVECFEANIVDLKIETNVLVVRDVFIHLPTKDILKVLSQVKYDILISTLYVGADNSKRSDKPESGYQPLDLRVKPFNLNLDLMIQEHAADKYLGIFYN